MLKLGIPGGLLLPFPGIEFLRGQFLARCPSSLHRKHLPSALIWAMSFSDSPVNLTDFGLAEPEFHAAFGFGAELPLLGRFSEDRAELDPA